MRKDAGQTRQRERSVRRRAQAAAAAASACGTPTRRRAGPCEEKCSADTPREKLALGLRFRPAAGSPARSAGAQRGHAAAAAAAAAGPLRASARTRNIPDGGRRGHHFRPRAPSRAARLRHWRAAVQEAEKSEPGPVRGSCPGGRHAPLLT